MSNAAKRSLKRIKGQQRAAGEGVEVLKATRAYVTIQRPARRESLGRAITEALDPSRAPGPVRGGAELRAEIAREKGVAIAPPRRCEIEGCTEEPGAGFRLCRSHGRAALIAKQARMRGRRNK